MIVLVYLLPQASSVRMNHILASERISTNHRFCPHELHEIVDSMILSDIEQMRL